MPQPSSTHGSIDVWNTTASSGAPAATVPPMTSPDVTALRRMSRIPAASQPLTMARATDS